LTGQSIKIVCGLRLDTTTALRIGNKALPSRYRSCGLLGSNQDRLLGVLAFRPQFNEVTPSKGLDRALLQRFRRFEFDAGPRFAAACRQEILRRWRESAGDMPLPHDWSKWGQDGDDFSMQLALQALEDSLCLEVAA